MNRFVVALLWLFNVISTVAQTVSYEQAVSYADAGNYHEAIRIMKIVAQQEKYTESYLEDIASISLYYSYIKEIDSVITYCEQTQQLAEKWIGIKDSIAEVYIQSTAWNYYECDLYERAVVAAERVLDLRDKIYGSHSQQAFEWIGVMSYQAFKKGDLSMMCKYCEIEANRAEGQGGIHAIRYKEAIASIRGYAHALVTQVPSFIIKWIEPYYERICEANILPRYQYEYEILLLTGYLTLKDLMHASIYAEQLEKWVFLDRGYTLPLEDRVRIELKLALYNQEMGNHIMARCRIENGWKMLEDANVVPSMAQLIDRHIVERGLYMDAQGHYRMNAEWMIKTATQIIRMNNENVETIAFFYESRALAYLSLQQYERAIDDMKKSIALKSLESRETNLAKIYMDAGKYKLAEKLFLDLYQRPNLSQPIKKSIEADLATLYWFLGKKNKLRSLLTIDFNNIKSEIQAAFAFMTENEREYFIDKSPIGSTLYFDFYTAFSNTSEQWRIGNNMAYDLALIQKGLLLHTIRDIDKLLTNAPDSIKEKKEQYDNFCTLIGDTGTELTNSLWRELMQYVVQQPDYLKWLGTTWQDVQDRLGNGEVAVEFINLLGITPTNLDSFSPSIGALVLTKHTSPSFVYLTDVAFIDSLYVYDDNGIRCDDIIYSGKAKIELYNKIWKPLLPYLKDATTIYYSPTGILHGINLDFIGNNQQDMLSDRYRLYRLSSTRELCNDYYEQSAKEVILYGNIAYSIASPVLQDKPVSKFSSTTRAGFCPLNGTAMEVDSICSKLILYDYSYRLYTGAIATENSFRQLFGKAPRILHIATHGFYYTEETIRKDFGIDNFMSYQLMKPELYHSGLALAGAQDSWNVKDIQQYIDSDKQNNGILLSAEISQMDLSGLDLVVLSACETALGNVKYEGVYGLQRAFKLAGAKSIIMSLWKVDDDATKKLMVQFYQNYLEGNSKQESLRMAQKTLRETPGYEEPYNWAAFILLDAIK